MNLRRLLPPVLVVTSLLVLAGCSTFESRARQKAAVFATLDTATRARLKAGDIRLGDTSDEVYIALGQPDEKRNTTTTDGQTSLWIYDRYWQEYQGDAFIGSRPIYVKNPTTGAVSVYYEPVSKPVYVSRSQERLRITFKDGRVSVVERPKDETGRQ